MSAKKTITVREDGTRESFIFYRSFEETINKLQTEDQLSLYRAVVRYGLLHEDPDFEEGSLCDIIWTSFKPQLDANWKRAISGVKGAEYGSRGGNPAFVKGVRNPYYPKDNPIDNPISQTEITPKITPNKNKNDNDNVNNNIPNGIISSEKQKTSSFNFNGLLQFWNNTMKNVAISQIREMTDKRKNAVRVILKTYSSKEIAEVIMKAARSRFLNGSNERNWTADFDFVFRSAQFTKILEGSYDDDKPNLQGMKSQSERNIEAAQREAIEQTAAIVEASRQNFASPDEAADYLANLNADTDPDPNEIFPD